MRKAVQLQIVELDSDWWMDCLLFRDYPRAIWWIGGLTLGLVSTIGLFLLARRDQAPEPAPLPS